MIPLTFRIDVLNDCPSQDVMVKYLDHYSKYLGYKEIADITKKPHYQGIVWVDDEKAATAAKTRWCTTFTTHAGSAKSMVKVKKETYEVYVTKSKSESFFKGYTPEDIQLLESKSYKKSDRKKPESNFQAAYDFCIAKGITIHSCKHGWDICDKLQLYYLENNKCEPTDFQLSNMTKSIAKKIIYDYSIKTDRKDIFERYVQSRSKTILGTSWTGPEI